MTTPDDEPNALTLKKGSSRFCRNAIEKRRVVNSNKALTRSQETTLILAAQAGDQKALETLLTANQGLIFKLAAKYSHPTDFPFEDARQEASLGFLKAVERFNTESGNKLSTYATIWICQALGRGRFHHEDLIKVPTHVKEDKAKILRVMGELTQELGREPTIEELAARVKVRVGKLEDVFNTPSGWLSLDARVQCPNGGLGDLLVDLMVDPVPSPDNDRSLEEFDLKQVVAGALALIHKEDADLLRRRYGIAPYTGGPQTFSEIGAAAGQSRQRVEQREKAAFHALQVALGLTQPSGKPISVRPETLDRNRAIVAAIEKGEEAELVAKRYSIGVRRVRQIVREMKRQQVDR